MSVEELNELETQYDQIIENRMNECGELLRSLTKRYVERQRKFVAEIQPLGLDIELPTIRSFYVYAQTTHGIVANSPVEIYISEVSDLDKFKFIILSKDHVLGYEVSEIKQDIFNDYIERVKQLIDQYFIDVEDAIHTLITNESKRKIDEIKRKLTRIA